MSKEHLSEEDLQLVALNQQSSDAEMLQHVDTCVSCQEQIAAYKLLITGVREQPGAAFDFDLANVILQQLPQTTAKKTTRNIRPFFIAAFVAIPLYLFRNNFLHLATGISSGFLLMSIIACTGIIVFKAISLYRMYERQIEKLNFQE
ncbi:MAG: hypothetical protein ABJB86_04145 [Bacteroidota bacterium]